MVALVEDMLVERKLVLLEAIELEPRLVSVIDVDVPPFPELDADALAAVEVPEPPADATAEPEEAEPLPGVDSDVASLAVLDAELEVPHVTTSLPGLPHAARARATPPSRESPTIRMVRLHPFLR